MLPQNSGPSQACTPTPPLTPRPVLVLLDPDVRPPPQSIVQTALGPGLVLPLALVPTLDQAAVFDLRQSAALEWGDLLEQCVEELRKATAEALVA
jgi:hypothetical protein